MSSWETGDEAARSGAPICNKLFPAIEAQALQLLGYAAFSYSCVFEDSRFAYSTLLPLLPIRQR